MSNEIKEENLQQLSQNAQKMKELESKISEIKLQNNKNK